MMPTSRSGLIAGLAQAAQPVLNVPFIRRTRRVHGLEHATITILATRMRNLSMAGRSDAGGFYLIGDAPTPLIEAAAHEALRRMRNGESGLAVHPNCGTNLVTTGLLATLVAMIGTTGTTRKTAWDRLPLVMLGVMATLVYSPPLGMALQRHFTTHGNPGDLEIVSIRRRTVALPAGGSMIVHRVKTRNG